MTALSIFPKFLKALSLDELGPRLRDCGLQAVNLLIRPGYWVEPGAVAEGVPRFVEAMRRAGLAVPFATIGGRPEELLAAQDDLRVLADAGVRGFRMGYFELRDDAPLSAQLAAARDDLQRVLPVLQRLGLRCVYQVHHGTLVPSPSLAALLVEGLPDAQFGVMPDVGNQGHEGLERWDRCRRVLGPFWSALGVKDTRVERRDGRPVRRFCPCQEGDTDWEAVAGAYADSPGRDRDPWVLQPFYHDDDVEAHLATLRDEVAFIRAAMSRAGLED